MAIISEEAREATAYFGNFIASRIDELKAIRMEANQALPVDGRPAPPKIYDYSDSLVAHLSWTFRLNSFPDGFTSPEKFAETVRFFQTWLNTTVSTVLQEEKERTKRHVNLADRLLRFIRDFDDVARFVLKHIPEHTFPRTITSILVDMATAFATVHASLQDRYAGRPTITVADEYDVQDLYRSMLKVFVSDIRLEEPVPSMGVKRSRADILLPDYKTIIEFKMTRDKLNEVALTEELLLDCPLYQRHQDCDFIHFFVFDPDRRVKNEAALQKALTGKHESGASSKPVVVSCVVVR